MVTLQSRRRFVTDAAVAGAAGFGALGAVNRGGGRKSFAAEPPPEITTIRLERDPFTCIAPQIVEELLRAEGFTDIRYVDLTLEDVRRAEAANVGVLSDLITRGKVDFARDLRQATSLRSMPAHPSPFSPACTSAASK
jgi:hypothetical protein